MKVGILTYHWVPNFGAQLQTLSTYKYLENHGYSPIIINWVPKDTQTQYNRVKLEQRQMHDEFMNNNCTKTEEFSDPQNITSIIEKYGITQVVIGSDSLFNIYKPTRSHRTFKMIYPSMDHRYPNPFWGYGFENIPHIGLSISSQNAKYNVFKSEANIIGESLKHFSAITVRDKWTQSLVSYFTKGVIVPDITPDPVFAFNNNVCQQITKQEILSKFNLPDKYILFSFSKGRMSASSKWLTDIVCKFNKDGYKCVELEKSGGQNLCIDGKVSFPLDPLDWYNIIRFSSAYIGVLMHPVVICLHNVVPFFSLDHYGTGPLLFAKKTSSKIYDILKRADLLDYHFFEKNHLAFPSTDKVFELIKKFPVEKCSEFSKKQQQRCLDNYNYLLTELTNGKRY